ncbi:MAG: hypothetical protein GYA57_07540 [Myxococcales bacterium]|nr:hypothetical protein [Myxococcales bacterium]
MPAGLARAGTRDFEECFFEDPHFGCYLETYPECSYQEGGVVAEDLPPVGLSESPFVSVADPRWLGWHYGLAEENPDADGDGLWDSSETELAQRFAPYVLNARSVGAWGDDPSLGEPTMLFRVRPDRPGSTRCTPGECSPQVRRIRVEYAALWDMDVNESDDDLAGCGGHCGDNQGLWLRLAMDPSDPRIWWVVETDENVAWWYTDEDDAGLHLVRMYSYGKHHERATTRVPDGCGQEWICPPTDDPVRWAWHDGPGLYLARVSGNAAFDLADYPAGPPDLPRANNVGESDAFGWPFVDALDDFCIYCPSCLERWGTYWRCFVDEDAWDTRDFMGGLRHDPNCETGSQRKPMAELWGSTDRAFLDDLDGDGIPNDRDRCYLDPFDTGLWWPVPGSYSPTLDLDGDGIVDECDLDPSDPTVGDPTASDRDYDGIPDGWDLCPDDPGRVEEDRATYPGAILPGDADGDRIGNRCDFCPNAPRRDLGRVPPDQSSQYNRHPGTPAPFPDRPWDGSPLEESRDSDGDGIGDACDLCPHLSAPFDPGHSSDDIDYIHRTSSNECRRGSVWWSLDEDCDDVGDRCDNCPTVPNRDQHNCNAADEQALHPGDWGVTYFGKGDACDPMPCVDLCLQRLDTGWTRGDPTIRFPVRRPLFRSSFFEGWKIDEPLLAEFCTVGGDPTRTDPFHRPLPAPGITTEVKGCWCPAAELERCQGNSGGCRQGGLGGGTWKPILHGDGGIPTEATPSYDFKTLYQEDATVDRGRSGDRYEVTGNYAAYYREPGTSRRKTQDWLWLSDFGSCLTSYASTYIGMWFKTMPDANWNPPVEPQFRNTYTNLVSVGRVDIEPVEGGAELARIPEDVGEVLLPQGPVFGLEGRHASPFQWFADIVWSFLCRVTSPCPWPDWMFFDERGPRVGGLLVASWSPERQAFANMVGTRIAGNELFDVVSPSLTMSFDAKGMPSRYWLFGGLDASNAPVDQMWGAVRVTADAGGQVVAAESAALDDGGGSNGPAGSMRGENTWFQLARIPAGDPWPSARVGATLRCTGFGVVAGRACDNLCPTLDVPAAGASGSVAVETPGALLLVGGEGPNGLLDDIWAYGSESPTSDLPTWWSTAGRGWRYVGRLAGAEGGLTRAASVQIDRTLWLIGGRTASGATADVWKVDVDTGASERLVPSGGIPAARETPAVTYDDAARRILVFGGVSEAGIGRSDLWALDPATATWTRLAGECVGSGCPVVTGREALVADTLAGEVTVVADPNGPDAARTAWTLRDGLWWTAAEVAAGGVATDCDGDGSADPLAGIRCGTGSGGFPDHGRMLCDGATLACRAPVQPAEVLARHRMPGVRTVVAAGDAIYALRGSWVQAYRVEESGTLTFLRTLALPRAAHDIAVVGAHLLAADGRGLTVLRRADGRTVSSLRTCGKARRVFPVGERRAIVLGLRSVLLVDLGDPARPAVSEWRLVPAWDGGIAVVSGGSCPRGTEELDGLWDAFSPCGAFGRDVGAYDDGLLYVNVLGQVHVLDFRGGGTPVVAGSVWTGLLREMRAEGGYLFATTVWGERPIVGNEEGIGWTVMGSHELERWARGTAEGPWYSVAWSPAEVEVARRQGNGAR